MISRTLDLIFIDSFAFMINKTLGLILSTKICNYSWEGKGEELSQKEQVDTEHLPKVLISQDVERGHQN
ncbi:MAG: hypothetical protein RMX65_026505 [Nostoc sp. DedQUE01]|nr:hypothetical protein [Nostoc sp. DedQUE11]MDZ8074535.1 hypothetical protein [Nostoc sp. DedQUE01]MDZ8077668.1 hypothetical protein [Nostoc sp. DcaGUA01]